MRIGNSFSLNHLLNIIIIFDLLIMKRSRQLLPLSFGPACANKGVEQFHIGIIFFTVVDVITKNLQ